MASGASAGIRFDTAGDPVQAGVSILLVDDDIELCELLQRVLRPPEHPV